MSSMYPKIDTLYERGEDFKVDVARVRRPEFEIPRAWLVTEKVHGCNIRVSLEQAPICACGDSGACSDCVKREWVMRFDGRKANSQMPSLLVAHLQDTFALEGLKSLWRCKGNCDHCGGKGFCDEPKYKCPNLDPYPITLYGEGYGGGIQKGGGEYTSQTKGGAASFRLFDVLVGETWLRRADVEDVAARLGIKCVPLVDIVDVFGKNYRDEDWDLFDITEAVRNGLASAVAAEEGTKGHMAEGVVAFTEEPLYNNRGQRLMFKLKTQDFA